MILRDVGVDTYLEKVSFIYISLKLLIIKLEISLLTGLIAALGAHCMNILMICYYYPPLLDVGSKRSLAFSVYFKKHGWNPFVISVRNPDKYYCMIGKDTPPVGIATEYTFSLCNIYNIFGKFNGALSKILKLINIKLSRNILLDALCIPDIFIGWIPVTIIKGIKSIKKNNIDIIYVSCSPFSSAIIGVLLKKISGKFLVVDYRDPFAISELTSIFKTPSWRVKLNKVIERWIIKSTDLFIVNTEEVKIAYLNQYPISRNKTYVVPNGFDYVYFLENTFQKYKKFTIIYAGLFYLFDERNSLYTDAFFGGLALLKSNSNINKENFQFLFYGEEKDKIYEIAKSYLVEDLFVCRDRKTYSDILKEIKKSHLQLLRISKPMISTKLFEGVALNTPFLATIPAGEVEQIIYKYSPSSRILTEPDPEKVAKAILDTHTKYQNGRILDNKIDDFRKVYSRENLSLMLMKIISENIHYYDNIDYI